MNWILIIILILILIFLISFFRKRWARKKVRCDTEEEKLCAINSILSPFGFLFDIKQDIVISKNNSWQRELGYSDLYDLNAPFFNIVMDAEPIYFDYDNKHYRIEFWKGQYGITTGAEVGIYVREYNSKIPKGIYRSANDNERLEISFDLFKKCYLFSRKDFSWWLTGFDVFKFSKPKDLKMSISIKFPNKEMQIAFVAGLLRAGYTENKIKIDCNEVSFNYCSPLNYKLNKHRKCIKLIAQFFNYINCSILMMLTKRYNRTIDKLDYIRYLAPGLYKLIICKCLPQSKYKKK